MLILLHESDALRPVQVRRVRSFVCKDREAASASAAAAPTSSAATASPTIPLPSARHYAASTATPRPSVAGAPRRTLALESISPTDGICSSCVCSRRLESRLEWRRPIGRRRPPDEARHFGLPLEHAVLGTVVAGSSRPKYDWTLASSVATAHTLAAACGIAADQHHYWRWRQQLDDLGGRWGWRSPRAACPRCRRRWSMDAPRRPRPSTMSP